MLTPSRQRGAEFLDDPTLSADVAERSLRDVALANRLFGGTRAVLMEIRDVCREARREHIDRVTVLDVGTGLADIPVAIAQLTSRRGIATALIGLEASASLARVAQKRVRNVVAGDARNLPFASDSIDVITCSQVLHHFSDDEAERLLKECSRVARRRVIVADLRRSWVAMGLLWIVSFPLRFHPISRHDGVVSIRRGYTVTELARAVTASGTQRVTARRRLGWRVTATWNPGRTAS